jgi:hypothetical protein
LIQQTLTRAHNTYMARKMRRRRTRRAQPCAQEKPRRRPRRGPHCGAAEVNRYERKSACPPGTRRGDAELEELSRALKERPRRRPRGGQHSGAKPSEVASANEGSNVNFALTATIQHYTARWEACLNNLFAGLAIVTVANEVAHRRLRKIMHCVHPRVCNCILCKCGYTIKLNIQGYAMLNQ